VAGQHPLVTREEQLADIRQIYPPEREALGVVALGIELVGSFDTSKRPIPLVAADRQERGFRADTTGVGAAQPIDCVREVIPAAGDARG
jgi:hypothetical protein